MDLSTTTEPRSDQQNYDDYLSGPKTVTVTEVRAGNSEQPVEIHLAEYPGRPWKPSKSMRRVLVAAWGKDSAVYAGRSLTLYGDPEVRFGGQRVGGIKVSHLSDIANPITVALTVTRGKKSPHTVEPLVVQSKIPADIESRIDGMDDPVKLGQMADWLSNLSGENQERVAGLIGRVNDRIADLGAIDTGEAAS